MNLALSGMVSSRNEPCSFCQADRALLFLRWFTVPQKKTRGANKATKNQRWWSTRPNTWESAFSEERPVNSAETANAVLNLTRAVVGAHQGGSKAQQGARFIRMPGHQKCTCKKRKSWSPIQQKVRIEPAPPRPVRARCIQRPRALWCGGSGARKALFQESIPLTKTKADIAKFNRTLPS